MTLRTIALATSALALAALVALGGPAVGHPLAQRATTPVRGGTLLAGIPDNPDHLDPALSYTNEGWQILQATDDGLLQFRRQAGTEGVKIVPDIATTMPKVSKDGLTYAFTLRPNVRFSPPVDRAVRASDFKFAIERLFRVDSGGVGFYTGITGAAAYGKSRKGGISGIVANDARRTITFHLTERDGTFLDYLAIPFAFAVPRGTPDKDVSTIARWRVGTGPYMISGYVPKHGVTITRNPNFRSWTRETPDGYLDAIEVKIGVTPQNAVNLTANGQLDWYFEPVAADRLSEVRARYRDQVHDFARGNVTYFDLNQRKAPFDKLAVRQAVNYAIDRTALVKIFGGQGTPTENIIPPSFGNAYRKHDLYPYDLAKAKAMIAKAGVAGARVEVWSHNTDPTPKAAQYMASVLTAIGFKATVKTVDESVYWDTIATQKGDPQVAFNDWNQDYPEGQDFIDVILNGERITNVGNNNVSNSNIPALNKRINAAKRMPLGPKRDAIWAQLDEDFMRQDAGWVPFLNRQVTRFVSKRLNGLVFNPSYFELLPSMWLSK